MNSPDVAPASSDRPPKLLDRLRERTRLKHYSKRVAHVYVQRVRRYINFPDKHNPAELCKAEVKSSLTALRWSAT